MIYYKLKMYEFTLPKFPVELAESELVRPHSIIYAPLPSARPTSESLIGFRIMNTRQANT